MSAAPPTTAEVMAVAMSRELQGAELVQLGLASALGQTSAVLAKHLAPDGLLLEDPAALTLSDRPRRARLTRSEAEAEAGCILHFDVTEMVGQVMPNVAGRMRQFIRPLQVDAKGRINTYRVARKDGSWLRVAGLAGLAEVAEFANPFLLYIPGQDLRGFVEEVDFCVCAPLEARAAMGDARIVLVTDLAVFDFTAAGTRARSIHPGVSMETLRAATPAGVELDGAAQTAPPTDEELRVLREVADPLGLRDVEFLRGEERRARMREIARAEAADPA